MKKIEYEVLSSENIKQCEKLCNKLMVFQKSQATIAPEMFDKMNFETRMKVSFEEADKAQVIIAKDGDDVIGYVFSTINYIDKRNDEIPIWAPKSNDEVLSFYPKWLSFPRTIGCLSNLYVEENYRKLGIGHELFKQTMTWLESDKDVDIIFTFISNGNDLAYNFYINNGFIYSHEVFGGFIKAVYKNKELLK